jgi:carbamoyltransferase
MTTILGISAYYHDSAAAVIHDGCLVAAAQEERFSRIKHDSSFPVNAIMASLSLASSSIDKLDAVVYYEKPLLTFERLLETYIAVAPRGSQSFIHAMQLWTKKKLFLRATIRSELSRMTGDRCAIPQLLFSEHHLSHAGAAFYPSPFKNAAIICMDGVGEWATTSTWTGSGSNLRQLWEISFPHSLGLLYSAFTFYCGFKVNSGEYKLMGLAPYGKPIYAPLIRDHLIDIKQDGTFRLNLEYFRFHRGFQMTSRKFHQLFGQPPRRPETEVRQFHMDLASSIQLITEEVVLRISKTLKTETGEANLCLAGGVALNCVANGRLQRDEIFENIWIQPASGDAGSAVGAAMVAYYQYFNKQYRSLKSDGMSGCYLGPTFTNSEIEFFLQNEKAPFEKLPDADLFERVAELLDQGLVVGWFNGRMEFGPRALGGRSILGDPRNQHMQSVMNLKIKFRESFRPFAPSVLEEEASKIFDLDTPSPYMLLVAPVKDEFRSPMTVDQEQLFGIEKLNIPRSSLPAITHVDYSARVQTVSPTTNPRYYQLIKAFQRRTGCPALVNTSFNVRGEPIVCTPEDAYRCFMRTEMDALVLENQLLLKSEQPQRPDDQSWKQEFELD